MAVFNPTPQSPNAPDYTGASRGIPTNRAFQSLFEGLGEGIVQGAKVADFNVQENIRKDAQSQVDQTQNLFGVGAATPAAPGTPGPGAPMPLGLQSGQDYLRKVQNAYVTGAMKESHYDGLLQSTVKNLKAKYPGYEQQVDTIIQDITGITPANALVSALRREADDVASQEEKKKTAQRNWEEKNGAEIIIDDPHYFDKPADTRFTPAVESGVYRRKAEDSLNDSLSKAVAAQKASGSLKHEDVVTTSRKIANSIATGALNGGLNSLGTDYVNLQSKIAEFQKSGKVPTPEEQQQLINMGNRLKANIIQTTQNKLRTPQDQTGFNLWSEMDEKERSDVTKMATEPVDQMIGALTTGDTSFAAANANYIKAKGDQVAREMMEHDDVWKLPPAFKALGIDSTAYSIWLGGNTDKMRKATEALSPLLKTLGIDTMMKQDSHEPNKPSFTEESDRLGRYPDPSKKANNQLQTALIDNNIMRMSDPAIDPQLVENSISFMFGNKGGLDLSKFKTLENQKNVYSNLVNPRITQRVKELDNLKSGVWDTYSSWAYKNMIALNKEEITNLRAIPESYRNLLEFSFNEDTQKLELTPKADIITRPTRGDASRLYKPGEEYNNWNQPLTIYQSKLVERLNSVNKILDSVKDIAKIDQRSMGETIQALFASEGIQVKIKEQPSGPEDIKPQTNLLDQVPVKQAALGIAGQQANEMFAGLEQSRGLPEGFLTASYSIESNSGRNLTTSSAGAAGHFQFIPSTARAYGLNDPMDLGQSARAAADYAADNLPGLEKTLGRKPNAGELYLSHQQGLGGAKALMSHPDELAKDVVGFQAIYQNLPRELQGKARTMTAREFIDYWVSVAESRKGRTDSSKMEGRAT